MGSRESLHHQFRSEIEHPVAFRGRAIGLHVQLQLAGKTFQEEFVRSIG